MAPRESHRFARCFPDIEQTVIVSLRPGVVDRMTINLHPDGTASRLTSRRR